MGMSTTDKTIIIIAVLLAAFFILVALNKGRELYEQYSEFTVSKRRAMYRKAAYSQKAIERTIRDNRNELWRGLK